MIFFLFGLLGDALSGAGCVGGMEGGVGWQGRQWDNMASCSIVSNLVPLAREECLVLLRELKSVWLISNISF